MYENLANIEAMLVGMLLILLLVAFAFLLIIIYLSNRDKRFLKPSLRPVSDEKEIKDAINRVSENSERFTENIIQLIEDQKSSPLIEGNSNIAMLLMKNYGNSSAMDIALTQMGYCTPSDGMENKLFSLKENESQIMLLNIPSDLVNHLGVNTISLKYKNIFKNSFKTKFTYTVSKALTQQLDEKTSIYVIVQV